MEIQESCFLDQQDGRPLERASADKQATLKVLDTLERKMFDKYFIVRLNRLILERQLKFTEDNDDVSGHPEDKQFHWAALRGNIGGMTKKKSDKLKPPSELPQAVHALRTLCNHSVDKMSGYLSDSAPKIMDYTKAFEDVNTKIPFITSFIDDILKEKGYKSRKHGKPKAPPYQGTSTAVAAAAAANPSVEKDGEGGSAYQPNAPNEPELDEDTPGYSTPQDSSEEGDPENQGKTKGLDSRTLATLAEDAKRKKAEKQANQNKTRRTSTVQGGGKKTPLEVAKAEQQKNKEKKTPTGKSGGKRTPTGTSGGGNYRQAIRSKGTGKGSLRNLTKTK